MGTHPKVDSLIRPPESLRLLKSLWVSLGNHLLPYLFQPVLSPLQAIHKSGLHYSQTVRLGVEHEEVGMPTLT